MNTKKTAPPKELSKNLLPLTEKEMKVLSFIENFLAEQGISPSYQEIREHFGFASFNSVQNYLKQLQQKGYVQVSSHQKRGLQVLQQSDAIKNKYENLRRSSPANLLLKADSQEKIFSIPLLGRVAAGQPIEEMEHEEFIDVPPSLLKKSQDTFALKVKGESMIEDGIFDGDVILVQKQNTARNNEIVVASVEQESTVKRFFIHTKPPNSDGCSIELRPANAKMQSMWYQPHQVQIKGIVTGLIRKFS